jgi:hypothetical protein
MKKVWSHAKFKARTYEGFYRGHYRGKYRDRRFVLVYKSINKFKPVHRITFESHEAAKQQGWRAK